MIFPYVILIILLLTAPLQEEAGKRKRNPACHGAKEERNKQLQMVSRGNSIQKGILYLVVKMVTCR
jgi:hypothetical protein